MNNVLTKSDISNLINVLEQVAPSKLSDARILIQISDKLKSQLEEMKEKKEKTS